MSDDEYDAIILTLTKDISTKYEKRKERIADRISRAIPMPVMDTTRCGNRTNGEWIPCIITTISNSNSITISTASSTMTVSITFVTFTTTYLESYYYCYCQRAREKKEKEKVANCC